MSRGSEMWICFHKGGVGKFWGKMYRYKLFCKYFPREKQGFYQRRWKRLKIAGNLYLVKIGAGILLKNCFIDIFFKK